jgi:hypothetical protein
MGEASTGVVAQQVAFSRRDLRQSWEGFFVGGLQPWHVIILLVLFLVVIGIVLGIVVIVRAVSKPKSKTPGIVTQSGAAPGWYHDPRDPTVMRYFDGRPWTSSTGPVS